MLPTGLAGSPRVKHPGGFSSPGSSGCTSRVGHQCSARKSVHLSSPAPCAVRSRPAPRLHSVLPGGVVLESGEAAQAQPRGVLRCGGREHCVKEDEDENTQLQPGGAQSRGRGHCERCPGTGVSSVHGPFGWGCRLLLASDVTAFGFIIG